jgi:hypothetical protein
LIKRINGKTEGYRKNQVNYTLLHQQSSKLAILLPGRGYSVEAPLLFYSTGLLFSKGYNVLHINYQYDNQEFSQLSPEEQTQQIRVDVDSVIDEVLADDRYDEYCLIAKSIGTIGLSHLVTQDRFKTSKTVWLTPLLTRDKVFQAMLHSHQECLSIIGDSDPIFQADLYEKLQANKNMSLICIERANHSLEFDHDIFNSIDVLKQVLKEIDYFMRS